MCALKLILFISLPYIIYPCIVRCIKGEPSIEEYYEMALQAEAHRELITEAIMQLSSTQQFLVPGRLVVVKSESVCLHHICFSLCTLSLCLPVPLGNDFYLDCSVTLFP